MTSEIAVMNQRAVALAADSAVTLIERGKIAVRTERQKLFNLADGLPVGVMFFGVADMMGHPWDVLLEHFQSKEMPGPQPHVRDYAVKFTDMLDNLEAFFPRSRQKDDYRRLLGSVFHYVLRFAHYLRQSAGAGEKADLESVRKAVDHIWHRYQFQENGTPRRDLPCFPQGFGAVVARDYADAIEELISYAFSGFALDDALRKRLREIGVFCVVKDLFLEDVTGLVVAGFGTEDHYPAAVTYNISAVVNGIVKRAEVGSEEIGGELRSGITLYAESDASYAFLRGMEMDVEAVVYSVAEAMSRDLVDQVVNSFSGVDPEQRENVRRQFHSGRLPQHLARFYAVIETFQQEFCVNPIMRVLEVATRQDLAETARDLVALNIFKKRISAELETAGGEIDVAVISREGGFQRWQKQGG